MKSLSLVTLFIFSFSFSCATTQKDELKDAPPLETQAVSAFTVVAPPDFPDAEFFVSVDGKGAITANKKVIGILNAKNEITRDEKVEFVLKDDGTIVNAQGEMLDAQIQNGEILFKNPSLPTSKMGFHIDDEGRVFASAESPKGENIKKEMGKIEPFIKDNNDVVLFTTFYALLRSLLTYQCKAKQAVAKSGLQSLQLQQLMFFTQNERYATTFEEIGFAPPNHYDFTIVEADDKHFVAKAKAKEGDDEWQVNEISKPIVINDACE